MNSRNLRVKVLRGLGSLMIVAALVVFAVLIYRFWWTNVASDRAAERKRAQLETMWDAPLVSQSAPQTEPTSLDFDSLRQIPTPKPNDAFALIYIPRLIEDAWGVPILEGVKQKQLGAGIGHYPGSALPGNEGNFSLFGHRTAFGEPLVHIEQLVKGDEVIVRTADYWFVYILQMDRIVEPSALGVTSNAPLTELQPDPNSPYHAITLITCEPRWSDAKRWVWWGTLSAVYPASTPPLVILAVDGR